MNDASLADNEERGAMLCCRQAFHDQCGLFPSICFNLEVMPSSLVLSSAQAVNPFIGCLPGGNDVIAFIVSQFATVRLARKVGPEMF